MTEFWINNDQDWKDLLSFVSDEKLTLQYVKADSDGNGIFKAGQYLVHVPKMYKLPEAPKKTKHYDPLIFGKDTTQNIVNITIDNEVAYIYFSDGTCEKREYYNWAVGAMYDEGCQRLKGNQYYKYIKELPEDQFYQIKNNWNPRIWTPRTANEGFMLRSGMTYFKGMKVSDVSLMSFDIEAPTLDPNAGEAKVVLFSTTYRDRTGQISKRLFDIFDYDNETDMWKDIETYIKEKNPDIILGHNILSYDLPYSSKTSPISLNWGRDGSALIFDEKASKIRKDGSQQYDFFNCFINGREIVDTFFLSLKYDISRDFPSYGLKAIEKYLGLVNEDRSWNFQEWPVSKLIEARKVGNLEIWKKFREYCQDDSDSPIKMFDIMIPSFFYLCQSVPKSLQQMINEASGSQLDSLMIRSYLQDGFSLPRSSRKEEFEGAISMGVPGVYNNVRKVDVASLYPSIMLQYEIYDNKKDPNRHMLKMLEYFRTQRLENKKLAQQSGDKYYDDLQNSQKIMINSMYGFMGAGYLLFNYPEGAALVTKHGREILLKGVEWATGHTLKHVLKDIRNEGTDEEEEKYHWVVGEKVSSGRGYTLVNVDTDSFSYTNALVPSTDGFKKEIEDLNSIYPNLISWEDDGVYEKVIVVRAKNYVLKRHKDWCKPKELDKNGNPKVKIKGSSLTDQKKEPRLLKLLDNSINVLLNSTEQKETELLRLYNECCGDVVNHFNVKDWVTKKTVTQSILTPKRANEQKPFNAIQEAIKKDVIKGIQEGDKVWLYVALDGLRPKMEKGKPVVLKKTGEVKMIPNDIYRFSELWNGQDQYIEHYLERVFDTMVILSNVVDITKFPRYHQKKDKDLIRNLP